MWVKKVVLRNQLRGTFWGPSPGCHGYSHERALPSPRTVRGDTKLFHLLSLGVLVMQQSRTRTQSYLESLNNLPSLAELNSHCLQTFSWLWLSTEDESPCWPWSPPKAIKSMYTWLPPSFLTTTSGARFGGRMLGKLLQGEQREQSEY